MSTPKDVTDRGIATVTPTTIIVHFTNSFSPKYGEIINYTVIVATDIMEQNTQTHATLPGWKAAQVDPSIKAYQAIANCSSFFEEGSTCNGMFRLHKRSVPLEDKIFEIGTESNCYSRTYCNGPLKPQTQYYVKLRGYTQGGYTDTNYSKPFVTSKCSPLCNRGLCWQCLTCVHRLRDCIHLPYNHQSFGMYIL